MFVTINEILCVEVDALCNELQVVTKSNYKNWVRRGLVDIMQRGGNGRKALVNYLSIPTKFQKAIESKLGYDPKKKHQEQRLEKYIIKDDAARTYYLQFRSDDGRALGRKKAFEYALNIEILQGMMQCEKETKAYVKSKGNSTRGVWQGVVDELNKLDTDKYPHSLPSNQRTLKNKIKAFKEDGYDCMIHGQIGNKNRTKIDDATNGAWLIVEMSAPNKPTQRDVWMAYNVVREKKGWSKLSLTAVKDYLNKPLNKRLWYVGRHGEKHWRSNFGATISRSREGWFPNAWWAIDGTKLDIVHYYDNALKMAAKARINVVVDVHSEKIIGWSLSQSEKMTDHFTALKMSVERTGCRPQELSYDSQSGHTSKTMQDLYSNIIGEGGKHYKHRVKKDSSGDGSPIEGLFRRLQMQVVNKYWASDKQSPTVKRLDNKPNLDFVKRHKEKLPTFGELQKIWEAMVVKWNSQPHPHIENATRDEVYSEGTPDRLTFDPLEVPYVFMIGRTGGNLYDRSGLKITIDKRDYLYEVYDDNGDIDLDFRMSYVGERFTVKYDPTSLDSYVALYKLDTDEFVAFAEPKRRHQTIESLKSTEDRQRYRRDVEQMDAEVEMAINRLNQLRESVGWSEEGMIDKQQEEIDLLLKLGGDLNKNERNKVDASIYDEM